MAGRIRNRRELRKQADQAEQAEQQEPAKTDAAPKAAPRKKAAASAAKPRAPRPRKKKEQPRLCARWGVFDGSMKQVAIFDYNQRPAAAQKVADLMAKKNAPHFLQIVKEAMPEPEPAEAPSA